MQISKEIIEKAIAAGYKLSSYEQWQYDNKGYIVAEKTGIAAYIEKK